MVDEWCGSEGALGVPPLVLQNVATVAQDPGGELFEAVVDRLLACHLARVANKKKPGARRPSPSQPFESIGNDGGWQRPESCIRVLPDVPYYLRPARDDRYARSRVVGALYKHTLKPAADCSRREAEPVESVCRGKEEVTL